MRVVIVGAGGVGGYLGVRLNQSGQDVAWLARGRNLAYLCETGIALRSPLGDVKLGPQQASDSPEALGRADLVIVTVKLYDLGDLAPRLRPLLGPSTAVLPLQNGVEAYAMLAACLPAEALLKGTVAIKSRLASPGEIVCKSPFCRIKIGEGAGVPGERVERIVAVLNACIGVEVAVLADIDVDIWKKFAMLASFSAISCLARASIGEVLDSPEARELVIAAANEAAAVGRALGVGLPRDVTELVLSQVRDMPKDGRPSMLEDLEAGRRLELKFLSGSVVRLGRQAGVPTPLHSLAYRVLAMHALGR